MNKSLSLLGICRKAGRITCGYDAVVEEIKIGKSKGVIITEDISDKTRKNVKFFCDKFGISAIAVPFTQSDIEKSTGKKAGVISINDKGLFEAIKKSLESEEN